MMTTAQAALAQVGSDEEQRNRDLIAQSFDAWRTGTGGPYDLLAADVSWTITGNSLAAKTYPTKDAFIGEVIQPFNARMKSPLVPTVRKLYAQDDTVVAFFDATGIATDDRRYSNTYAWILEMDDGQIVRAHAFFDSIAFDDLWQRIPVEPNGAAVAREAPANQSPPND